MKDLYMNIKNKTGESRDKNLEVAGEMYLSFLNLSEETQKVVSDILNVCNVKDYKIKLEIIDKNFERVDYAGSIQELKEKGDQSDFEQFMGVCNRIEIAVSELKRLKGENK